MSVQHVVWHCCGGHAGVGFSKFHCGSFLVTVRHQANKNKPPNSAHQKSRREETTRKEGKTEGKKKKK
jgi:hypothetical protein